MAERIVVEFREEYGNVMIQTLLDRHKLEAVPPWRLVWREAFDAAQVAPQMRLDSPMNRIIMRSGRNRPVASGAGSRRGLWWLAAGLAGIGAGIAIPAIDGGELNGFWWTVMALALLAGIAMTIAGVVTVASDRSRRSGQTAAD